ncbi:hypothetical protein [Cellulomonas sp. Y8]|uniref:hypothetical protein n=1 Tax=Cellulomonas sp. Y8 TaxID=2591145 RepID=UPI0011CCCDED|nr:hypothetical protein [Cellulomonas sp. Y8]
MSATYVVGVERFEIAFEPYGEELFATLTIRIRGDELWRSTERSWRPVGIGNGTRSAYIWTARTLVELSTSGSMWSAKFDEDLIWVYQAGAAWVAVCETSVRLVGTEGEVDRWELADVVAEADWRGEKMYVRDVAGREVFLRVHGDEFHPSVP